MMTGALDDGGFGGSTDTSDDDEIPTQLLGTYTGSDDTTTTGDLTESDGSTDSGDLGGDDSTAMSDLINDARSQVRPDTENTDIEVSTQSDDTGDITVTDTDAGNTVVETDESTTGFTDTDGTEAFEAVVTDDGDVTQNPNANQGGNNQPENNPLPDVAETARSIDWSNVAIAATVLTGAVTAFGVVSGD